MTNQQVLLLGNGLNLCFNKPSWEEIIKQVQSKFECKYSYEQITGLPFPMQVVVASDDQVNEAMKFLSEKMKSDVLCNEQRELLEQYLSLPFDTLLTTNYTFELEQALGCPAKPGKYRTAVHYIKKCTPREKQFGLYKCFEINGKAVWHIHGDLSAPNSVIMGQYYYGKALREYQNYIATFMRRYRSSIETFVPQSWLDHFMIGDVHIVGLGMDPAEMDLWWLINCKKRNMPNTKVYFYTPSFEDKPVRDIMLDIYGVENEKIPVANNNYKCFHTAAIIKIKENIGEHEV